MCCVVFYYFYFYLTYLYSFTCKAVSNLCLHLKDPLFIYIINFKKHSSRGRSLAFSTSSSSSSFSSYSMALEAVVYPQSQEPFLSYGIKDIYNYNFLLDADFNLENEEEDQSSISSTFLDKQTQNYLYGDLSNSNNCSSTSHMNEVVVHDVSNSNPSSETNSTSIPSPPPKKRRAKTRKNEQEIENQRMTHIAVERNRRKQMNHYLSLLRSLMPESYVQRVRTSISYVPMFIMFNYVQT